MIKFTGIVNLYKSNPTPTITSDVTVDGRRSNGSNVSINGNKSTHIFIVGSGGKLTVKNITLKRGKSGVGAAIATTESAEISVMDSEFINNEAENGGGAIYADGKLTVTGSVFRDNEGRIAGAIRTASSAAISITNNTFRGNEAVPVDADEVVYGGALAIYNCDATTVITGNYFRSNEAVAGGAVFIGDAATVTMRNNTFHLNEAKLEGGAVEVRDGLFAACTSVPNVSIENSTFYKNNQDGRITGTGAAIYNYKSTVTLTHVTIYDSDNESSSAATVYTEGSGATTNIRNSIIAGTGRGKDCGHSGAGVTVWLSSTLIEDKSCSHNRGGDPKIIDKLITDRGVPPYLELKKDSPAIDVGTTSFCLAKDQSGHPRPQRNGCDIGAFELPDLVPGDTWSDRRPSATQDKYEFYAHKNQKLHFLLESPKRTDSKISLEILDKDGTSLKSAEVNLSKGTLAGIYNWSPSNSGLYSAKVYTRKASDSSDEGFYYELTMLEGSRKAIQEESGLRPLYGQCEIGGTDNALWFFSYEPPTFGLNVYASLKFVENTNADPWMQFIWSTRDEGSKSDQDNLVDAIAGQLGHDIPHIAAKSAVHAAYDAMSGSLSAAAAGASTNAGILSIAKTVAMPIVAKAAIVHYTKKAIHNVAYQVLKKAKEDELESNVFSEYTYYLQSFVGNFILPNAYSKGFLLAVHASNFKDDGLLVFTVSNLSLKSDLVNNIKGRGGALALREVSHQVQKAILCPGKLYNQTAAESSRSSRSSRSSSASAKVQTLSTGAQINADQTDGVRVSSVFGVNSGIQFQRRDPSTVNTIKAANIQTVINAGVKDAIDIWGYAEQQANTCFENSFVGATGGIMFIKNAGLSKIVHASPATTTNGSETCIQTTGPGLVVLVANMPPGSPQPAPEAAPAPEAIPLTDCMTTTTDMLNLRASPGGDVVTILPYNVTLTTSKLSDGWFEVNFHGTIGWVSAGWVTTSGNCGGEESRAPSDSGSSAPASYAPAVSKQAANADATQSHVVQPGDTLLGIAIAYGVSLDDILRLNQIANANSILVGQALRVR